jgi:predicted Zn-dependent protease
MLERGDLKAARALLQVQLGAHPENGRLHLVFGHLLYAEQQVSDALGEYRQAVDRDPGLRVDAALVANVRGLLDDKEHAGPAVALMCEALADRMAPDLARVAAEGRTPELRQRARAALAQLGPGAPVDWVKVALADLRQARSCAEKREIIGRLKRLGDRRALPDLKRMHAARRGFLGHKRAHACVLAELSEAIASLGEGPGPPDGGAKAGNR